VENRKFFNFLNVVAVKAAFLAAYAFFPVFILAQNPLPVIPKPNFISEKKGNFKLSEQTVIESNIPFEAEYLRDAIKKQYGLNLRIVVHAPRESSAIKIALLYADTIVKEGKNNVTVTEKEVVISALNRPGIFYGVQTLIQLISFEKSKGTEIPCVNIDDSPFYQWRGMHLDVCRHFFTKEEVKKYIDYLALYKFNVFHWHLTEDQGWRIEIKKYPKLTETGAWRKGSQIGAYKDQKFDTLRYGGFYSQEDIKEIVSYATKRHVTIVPEIEMPGHSLAALAAYPQFSCTGGPFEVAKGWGVFDDVYCSKEETFKFLQDVLDEVCVLFPGKYIHIGGDECPKTRWKNCPHCQALIKKENLKDEHGLQSYFITRIEKYLNTKGKQIIGWDEILEGGLAPNAAVMSWRGTDGGIAAAKQKHFVVMSPGRPCYFDHYQSKDISKEPLAIGGFNPLDSVYAYNPTPQELSEDEQKYILGAQGNVWTEYIATFKQVEYMSLPRMCALAEVLWTTSKNKNYADFILRLQKNKFILDTMGTNYAKHFLLNTK
jgi:hexosaminidase